MHTRCILLLAIASKAFASPIPKPKPQFDLSMLSPFIGGGSQDPVTALTEIGNSLFGGSGNSTGNALAFLGSLLGGAEGGSNPLGALTGLLGGAGGADALGALAGLLGSGGKGDSPGGGAGGLDLLGLLGGLGALAPPSSSSGNSGETPLAALMGAASALLGSSGGNLGALAGLLGGGDPLSAIAGLLGGAGGGDPLAALAGLFGGGTNSSPPAATSSVTTASSTLAASPAPAASSAVPVVPAASPKAAAPAVSSAPAASPKPATSSASIASPVSATSPKPAVSSAPTPSFAPVVPAVVPPSPPASSSNCLVPASIRSFTDLINCINDPALHTVLSLLPMDPKTLWNIVKSFPGPDLRSLQVLLEIPNLDKYVGLYLDFRNYSSHILFGGSVPNGPAPSECSKYELIVARGTGEYGPYGFLVGDPFVESMQKELPGLQAYAVQYPAGLAAESWQAGVKDVVHRLNTQSKKCPDTKFGLVGYSQGAMVMHIAVSHNETDATALRTKVVGGAMFGDPYYGGNKFLRLMGSAAPSSVPKFPSLLDSKIKNVCAVNRDVMDPVCSPAGSLNINPMPHVAYNVKDATYMKDTTDYLVKLFKEHK